MKKTLIVSLVFTLMFCSKIFGETPDFFEVNAGLAELATNDLVDASSNFEAAVAFNPANQDANVMLGITRLMLVPQTPAGSNFLNGLNFPAGGRDIFNWTSTPPKDALGGPIFLPNYNSTNIVFFFRTNVMPLIAASLTNFANLTDSNFLLSFAVTIPSVGEEVTNTIDYGDVQLFRAGLNAADFLGDSLDANNASVILPQIVSFGDSGALTIQKVLATYPSLLTPHNTNDLIPSELALSNAATLYLAASDFIRNYRLADDTNDLITIATNEVDREANFRMDLTNVLSSLIAPTQFNPYDPYSIVNLQPYFSGNYSVRKEVPQFNNDAYVNNTLPDYTFGGILPDEPAYRTEAGFRGAFPPLSGFYIGNVYDDFYGENVGSFMAFCNAANQITIVGYNSDAADFGPDQDGGFLIQVTADVNGNWQINSSTVVGSGKIERNGSFDGTLYFVSGNEVEDQIELDNSFQISPPGPYQGAAGYYTGSASGNSNGHALSASLSAILAPDGEFVFSVLSGTNADGGYTQLQNNTFDTFTADNTEVIGTLNPATFKITGNFYPSSGGNGQFTLSRSASLTSDTPPAITSDLPTTAINIPLGNTVTFTLGATGSVPLSYRWFINGSPILWAKSNTLVVSNQLWNGTGTYYITASVNNVAGEADSQQATVNVSTETNVPTVKITSPTPGQLWSNAQFTVTGTTSDKVGITGVYYYVNNGMFAEATNTSGTWSTWTANVTLSPGTNTINVYAYNLSPVPAITSVKVVYVQTGFLTVITNGPGTITPAYTNALRLGQVYSLTAKGAPGYKLGSWTGGTNQPFSVYTNGPTVLFTMSNNLTMQANFIDTNQPLVKITNVAAGSGLVLTNNNNSITYTVMGTATGVEAVQGVQYSLNGSAFAPVASYDGLHWSSAPLSLEGGTNIFSVYATGTNGINSATNSVRIFVITSNLLQISVSGKGTISPNYSNAVLRVGQAYTVTATPLHGWAFTNWTGAISGSPMIPITTKSILTFLMQSNLMLQANFVDTNQPIVKITNAVTGLVLSSNFFAVMGTVTNDVAIASVNCSLNGSPAEASISPITNGLSWSAPLTFLRGGTNFFSVYAVATNGNVSATNTLRLIFVSTNQLTLQTSGQGTISPNYSNAWLHVGQAYAMTATAAKGFVLASWSGSTNGEGGLVILTNKPTVSFIMFSNLIMQANFTDTNKPFVKITNAPLGAVVTNQFILMGTVTDDVEIAVVNCSLNGSPVVPTTSPINNGDSWSADLTLAPGTNKFAAYAVATNGNVSATNTLIIVRQAAMTSFQVATNITPQAQLAFDGANYLVVFQGRNNGNGQAVGQFVSPSGSLVDGTFPISPGNGEDTPTVAFDGANYLVTWLDFSQNNGGPVNGAFVSPDGTVQSPIQLSQSTTADDFNTMAYGGGVYLLMWSDSSTVPDSQYGALIDTSGNNTIGDFPIGPNGHEDEAGQGGAAFDGTNFLAVWASATGNMSISGQFINPSTGPSANSPILIYTNATPAGHCIPCVVFDGTKYLVLFNVGVNANNPGSYHILGRFVTTSGQVLTNQITLTSDAGPQIFAGADFDGANYLVTWNQGLNPFTLTTSATINGRYFDSNGVPTSAEFPILKTQPGSRIPTWAPVLYDPINTQFVLMGGIGKMTGTVKFTNGTINGVIIPK